MGEKRVGLALGSGFVRGLTHIGILKAFEDHNIPIGMIAGTSMGALIGGSYCCGNSPEDLEEYMANESWKDLVDFTMPKTSIISNLRIKREIKKLTKNKFFNETRIPLRVVATDLNTREEVVFISGKIAKAVTASTAVPGIFSPVNIKGRELVDGGLVDPIPIETLDKKRSDVVVAVDISTKPQNKVVMGTSDDEFTSWLKSRFISTEFNYLREAVREGKFFRAPVIFLKIIDRLILKYLNPNNIINFMSKTEMPKILKVIMVQHDILMNQLVIEKLKNPILDFVIRPELRGVTRYEFDKADYIIKQGEKAAKKVIPKIKRLL